MKLRSIKQADLKNKRVLLRVDFNVTQNFDHTIADDMRIKQALPTIEYLRKQSSTLILISHLGRPDGKIEAKYSLKHVVKRLEKYIGTAVMLLPNFWEPEVVKRVNNLPQGTIVMCENLRFHPGEEQNDPQFSQILASFGEIFVNDAFSVAHRAHASTVGVSKYLPSFAGLLLLKEVETIHRVITKPRGPLLVIIGGNKTPEKIRVINKLLDTADTIYLGGTIANTFFAAMDINVGISKVDPEIVTMAKMIILKAKRRQTRLILPKDVVVSSNDRTVSSFVLPYNKISPPLGIFDIGPKSIAELSNIIKTAKTILWNGPMGQYEDQRFSKATKSIFSYICRSKAKVIIGGGDTMAAIKTNTDQIAHVSTGGGALLDFIEKETLPGLEALKII